MDQASRLDAGMRLKAAMPEKPLASRWGWLAFPTKVGNRAFSQVVPFPLRCIVYNRPLDPLSDAAATPAGQRSGLLVKLAVFGKDLAADTLGQ